MLTSCLLSHNLVRETWDFHGCCRWAVRGHISWFTIVSYFFCIQSDEPEFHDQWVETSLCWDVHLPTYWIAGIDTYPYLHIHMVNASYYSLRMMVTWDVEFLMVTTCAVRTVRSSSHQLKHIGRSPTAGSVCLAIMVPWNKEAQRSQLVTPTPQILSRLRLNCLIFFCWLWSVCEWSQLWDIMTTASSVADLRRPIHPAGRHGGSSTASSLVPHQGGGLRTVTEENDWSSLMIKWWFMVFDG